jgi:hypothetical protein
VSAIEGAYSNTKLPLELFSGTKGPVTASRHRRTALIYGLLCILAVLPLLLHKSPSWQAAGLGLFVPGSGFLAVGGWWVLLFPVTLFIFWISVIAWFWAGMVIAPLTVWLGSAALAGILTGDEIWAPAMYLAPAAAVGVYGYMQYRRAKRQAADVESFKLRQTFFAESLTEVVQRVATEPVPGTRELTPEQLKASRFLLDLALQPVGEFNGYTIIDQFQPAALRYQINHLGFALGMLQGHYVPSFHGYMRQAGRNAVDTYLTKKVWDYWVLESMWGHFNFSNFDPARKDNIMLTGWFGMHVGSYMINSGDRKYETPGSLTFRLNERTAYAHDYRSLIKSVTDNFNSSDFCLYPCEPNWVYPMCNMYGMCAVATNDRLYQTKLLDSEMPRWMNMLENEFVDGKGSLVGLRSYWTGIEMPFYTGEAGFAFLANPFSPDLGRRLWAIGRKELAFCMTPDKDGNTRLTIPRDLLKFIDTIDAGHYRPGMLFAYAAVLISAREFGDHELAEAALRSIEQDCGPEIENGGAVRYTKGSTVANIWAAEGILMRTGDFRNSFVKGPPESVFRGPILNAASYPEVLVAKAFSHGDDLDLVLYPGVKDGQQSIGIERLKPQASYQIHGSNERTFQSDANGCIMLSVELSGRTPLHIVPA